MINLKLFGTIELKPEILTHPNIPVPLHGINPRSIKGKTWWDKIRKEANKRTKNRCSACGVQSVRAKKYKYLEGHEFFNIDYYTGICEVISIEPLCHYCHNFIHSGRLSIILDKEKSKSEVVAILEHGFKILADNSLQCFPYTLKLAKSLGANTHGVNAYKLKGDPNLVWEDYVFIFEGKEYRKPNPNPPSLQYYDEAIDPAEHYELSWHD